MWPRRDAAACVESLLDELLLDCARDWLEHARRERRAATVAAAEGLVGDWLRDWTVQVAIAAAREANVQLFSNKM